ncbi:MAG: AAA family ATPase [Candidatus Aenigmatarchaeota archaeon]
MLKFVVGITGTLASGKDTVKEILSKNFNCYTVSLSSVIQTQTKIKADRKTLQDMGNELRKKYGNFILAKLATDYLQKDREMIIIDGIRNPGEVDFLKKTFKEKFFLIAVDAPLELRWERMKARGKEGDPKTFEEFLKADERDQGIGEPLYGQRVRECMEMADFLIINDGTLQQLNEKVGKIVEELKKRQNFSF